MHRTQRPEAPSDTIRGAHGPSSDRKPIRKDESWCRQNGLNSTSKATNEGTITSSLSDTNAMAIMENEFTQTTTKVQNIQTMRWNGRSRFKASARFYGSIKRMKMTLSWGQSFPCRGFQHALSSKNYDTVRTSCKGIKPPQSWQNSTKAPFHKWRLCSLLKKLTICGMRVYERIWKFVLITTDNIVTSTGKETFTTQMRSSANKTLWNSST